MTIATGISPTWGGAGLWPAQRGRPLVVVLAGIDNSAIVDAALADTALTEAIVPRFEPACTPPCDALVWRLETASGESLNQPGLLLRHWHRPPYAVTVRLVQYQAGSVLPEILDEGTLGTRGPRASFKAAVDRLAMRFVRDAALGRGRGPAGSMPAADVHGLPGWVDAIRAKWQKRLMAEWWSLGTSTASVDQVLSGGGLGDIDWCHTQAGDHYLADPFPWPGTDRILCEEMPVVGGVGRIVAVALTNEGLSSPEVLLDDGAHHSYPCTFRDGGTVYCVPESTQRGATWIHRLGDDSQLEPTCEVAPHCRLADPTLFRWQGRYWLACTDLDLGEHDNLCLLHAPEISGPWTKHARWPVKIDIRGARPAGQLFNVEGRLFRPGQDCAATYGAAVTIHEVQILTETDFRESLVCVARPDRLGAFPNGLHTLVNDGERFWVDGKRFVLDWRLFGQKIRGRASRALSRIGVC